MESRTMKDFFILCLKDLESISGLRQLFFLQSDLEDGERKKDVLIAGMVATCKNFDYIPEKAQQKIIREMMVKDQDYDSLNSRVIYKWLNMHKDVYFTQSHAPEITPLRDLTDDEKKRIDQLAEQFKKSLVGDFRPAYHDLQKEIDDLKLEDLERQEGKHAASTGYIAPGAEYLAEKELKRKWMLECFDLHTGKPNEKWMSWEEYKMM